MTNFAIYIRSYHQSNLPISTFYLHYKDLNETKVSFSHRCVEQRYSKPYTINEWNKQNPEIRRTDSFPKSIIKFY